MNMKHWTRRRALKAGFRAAAGSALAAAGMSKRAFAQFSPPSLLDDSRIRIVTTTEKDAWQSKPVYKPQFGWDVLNLNVDPVEVRPGSKPMAGFGACFNELGWTSLQMLSESDRESVLRELFDPSSGARFNYCRMPIGANDFATEAYSYDETDGDFELKNFSIAHDEQTLVPFIQAAIRYQPKLKLWASPWSPPTWMKRNKFYAEAKAYPGMKENGIRPDQIGHEGEDMFIQEPRYFEAYAKYFGRFIDAYRAKGIMVGMVMPQNEFNSAQNFPSCTWTPEGLTRFLHYLAPEMEKRGVEVFFGTLERGNPHLLEVAMADKQVARYIKGVGTQWAGKNALPTIHEEFPALLIYQSEQECGDGSNNWTYTGYCWQLMKHYLRSGASAYMYWNISVADAGTSTWGWAQNALVTVDSAAKTYRYNHDYYLLKHLTHFVDLGARNLKTSGTCDDALAFVNPDGSLVFLIRNELSHPQRVEIHVRSSGAMVELPPDSISTIALERSWIAGWPQESH
jgi:glucosylceramidase